MDEEIFFTPALELGERLRDRELSSLELTEAFLGRISQLDRDLGAYVTVTAELAREQAKAADERLDARHPQSRFDGVPISIKDLGLLQGVRTTLGSRAFAEFTAPFTSHDVQLIVDAGMVVLGKTNLSEFGAIPTGENVLTPPTRNPWNRDRTSGGSSAGAAAALATGMCAIAHGADGGGSVRIPAAACGVIGIKPSRGRISWGPMFAESVGGLSTSGPLARTVPDAAALLDRMSEPFPGDYAPAGPPEKSFLEFAREDPPPLKIGWYYSDTVGSAEESVVTPLQGLIDELEGLGHHLEAVEIADIPNIRDPFLVVWRTAMAAIPVSDLDLLDEVVRPLVEEGRRISAVGYFEAFHELNRWVRNFIAPRFDPYDVMVAPVLSSPPPPLGYLHEDHDSAIERALQWMHFTPPVNVAGLPAVAIPVGRAEGMPVGVQLIGRPYEEATVISLAAQIERHRGGLVSRPL